jgi:hypothetical protein
VGRLDFRSYTQSLASFIIERDELVAEPELDEERAGAFD